MKRKFFASCSYCGSTNIINQYGDLYHCLNCEDYGYANNLTTGWLAIILSWVFAIGAIYWLLKI